MKEYHRPERKDTTVEFLWVWWRHRLIHFRVLYCAQQRFFPTEKMEDFLWTLKLFLLQKHQRAETVRKPTIWDKSSTFYRLPLMLLLFLGFIAEKQSAKDCLICPQKELTQYSIFFLTCPPLNFINKGLWPPFFWESAPFAWINTVTDSFSTHVSERFISQKSEIDSQLFLKLVEFCNWNTKPFCTQSPLSCYSLTTYTKFWEVFISFSIENV